jgi:hypothetical protein
MNCLKCEKEILQPGTDEKGNIIWITQSESKKILHDGENDYILCKHCNSKNILEIDTLSKSPVTEYIITRYEE